jgi:murein DD-endopeptidase MepM/ murein hydrolase activator NlpD
MTFRRLTLREPLPPLLDRFGVRSRDQLVRDLRVALHHVPGGERFVADLTTLLFARPDLAFPAYAGFHPADGVAPVYHFFDRTGGGLDYHNRVTRHRMRDWRGGKLTYDEHDGTDFVCPPGTPVVAAAPGVAVAVRDRWLRGGLTLCVDHGHGVLTQSSHLSRVLVPLGASVRRGEIVALSGQSGMDMAISFPWVPPHVHFMVWVGGRPVDPYVAAGEGRVAGTWLHGSEPRSASGPLAGDEAFGLRDIAVDAAAIVRLRGLCADEEIGREIDAAPSDAARAAVIEDSLHHERPAWPVPSPDVRLRPPGDPSRVRLTLPLAAEIYVVARPADVPWTRPSAG